MSDKVKWCSNAKTGEIFSYIVSGDITDFPRGTFLAYGDYLTTGLKSRQSAFEWSKEWSACLKCKCSRHGKDGDKCSFCGETLKNFYKELEVMKSNDDDSQKES